MRSICIQFRDYAKIKDPKNQSYTKYSNENLLGIIFYKGIAGIQSMQSMTYEFDWERVVENLYCFSEKKIITYLRSMNILRGWI